MATNEPNKPDNVINIDPGNKKAVEEKAAPDQPLQADGEAPCDVVVSSDKINYIGKMAAARETAQNAEKAAAPPAPEEKAPEPVKPERRGRPVKTEKADKPEKTEKNLKRKKRPGLKKPPPKRRPRPPRSRKSLPDRVRPRAPTSRIRSCS